MKAPDGSYVNGACLHVQTHMKTAEKHGAIGFQVRKKEWIMMPLTMQREGDTAIIQRVGGKEEVRRHLENMGFVPGAEITVISINGGNVIVNVKEARVAISKEMANKIMV